MTLLDQLRTECPQAIKETETLPSGLVVPILGSVRDDGSHDIDPAALAIITRR